MRIDVGHTYYPKLYGNASSGDAGGSADTSSGTNHRMVKETLVELLLEIFTFAEVPVVGILQAIHINSLEMKAQVF